MSDSLPHAPTAGTPLSGLLRLNDWALIRARGTDAATFLQGQLTQDVQRLRPGDACFAGYCSPKGRLLASFVVLRTQPEEFLLACSADLLAPTLKRLSMYVLRAKCKLDDAAADWALYGVAGAAASALAPALPSPDWSAMPLGPGHAVRLPAAPEASRLLLALPAGEAAPDQPTLSADAWTWLEARSGVVRIVAATVEQFVPQMVNLELVGGVDFKKGCYPGQEIVARSQYRGTVKRRALRFDAGVPLQPGQEVFHLGDPGQPAGLVANSGRLAEGAASALVEVKLAALEGDPGGWRLGAADGPVLAPADLPYPLPSAEAA